MELRGATASHVGNVRETNQDRAHFGGFLAAVADGMGGHQGGEMAASIAISEFLAVTGPIGPGGLKELVEDANDAVFRKAADPDLRGMGTTLVALTLRPAEESVSIVNVGDSRAYFLRGGELDQLTKDHSLVEDLVRQNRLTPEEALTHPQRNILTRALGIASQVEVDSFLMPVELGDRFLLCSDGLFNEVTEEEISQILLDNPEPDDAASALIDAALAGAARDNVTVAVIDVVPDGQGGNLSPESAQTMIMPTPGLSTDDTVEAQVPAEVNNGFAADVPVGFDANTTPAATAEAAQTAQPVQQVAQPQAVTTQEIPVQEVPVSEAPVEPNLAGQPGNAILENEFGHSTVAPTAEVPMTSAAPARRGRWRGLVLALVVLALLYTGFHYYYYAYSGWHVGETDDGEVAIFRGRPWGVLWLAPTEAGGPTDGPVLVERLPQEAQEDVESNRSFNKESEAQEFVDGLAAEQNTTDTQDELSETLGGTTEPTDPAAERTTSTTSTVSPDIGDGDSGGGAESNTNDGDEPSNQGNASSDGDGDG